MVQIDREQEILNNHPDGVTYYQSQETPLSELDFDDLSTRTAFRLAHGARIEDLASSEGLSATEIIQAAQVGFAKQEVIE